jgi:hypothetical protein
MILLIQFKDFIKKLQNETFILHNLINIIFIMQL